MSTDTTGNEARRERVADYFYQAFDGHYPDWIAIDRVREFYLLLADSAIAAMLPHCGDEECQESVDRLRAALEEQG